MAPIYLGVFGIGKEDLKSDKFLGRWGGWGCRGGVMQERVRRRRGVRMRKGVEGKDDRQGQGWEERLGVSCGGRISRSGKGERVETTGGHIKGNTFSYQFGIHIPCEE